MVVAGAATTANAYFMLHGFGETHSGNAGSMLGKNQKRFIGVFSRMVFRAYPDKRKTYTIPLVGEFLFVSQFPETIIQAPKKSTRVITAHTAAFKLGGLFDILALFSISRVNL